MSCGMPPVRELEIAQDLPVREIDLDQAALELAGEDRELPSIEKSAWLMPAQLGVGIEYCSAIVCGSRKSSRLQRLGDHDGRAAVRREVHVVGIVDGDRLPGLPVCGSIGVRLPSVRAVAVIGRPTASSDPRTARCAAGSCRRESVDDLERRGIDHVDVVRRRFGT